MSLRHRSQPCAKPSCAAAAHPCGHCLRLLIRCPDLLATLLLLSPSHSPGRPSVWCPVTGPFHPLALVAVAHATIRFGTRHPRCKFDSNSTQNTSPALRVLCLVVSVTQSFETTSVHLYSKHKQTKELDFSKVSTTLEIFNVFLERYS